jgi:hypothetical protein
MGNISQCIFVLRRFDFFMETFVLNILGTYPIHIELLWTYAHFKSGLSNTHSTVPHFFTDKPSHHSYEIAGHVGGFICKKARDHWMSIGQSGFKMCICAQDTFPNIFGTQ